MITYQYLLKVSQNYGVEGNVKFIILASVPQKVEAYVLLLYSVWNPREQK